MLLQADSLEVQCVRRLQVLRWLMSDDEQEQVVDSLPRRMTAKYFSDWHGAEKWL